MNMNDFLRKEWRNLMWLIGLIISGIFVLKTSVSDVKSMKPKVDELLEFRAVQKEINSTLKDQLKSMNEKLDKLLSR